MSRLLTWVFVLSCLCPAMVSADTNPDPPIGIDVTPFADPDHDPRYVTDANPNDVQVEAHWTLLNSGVTPEPPPAAFPSPRILSSAIFDPLGRRMIVFGGEVTGISYDDVWALDVTAATPTWTQLQVTGPKPPGRRDQIAVYDAARHRMIIFGGTTYGASTRFNDVWALSLGGTPTWTNLSPGGTPPSTRFAHAGIYDPVRDRVIVFGGYSTGFLGDSYALSLSGTPSWSSLSTGPGPSARNAMSAVYDPDGDRMLVFGGFDGTNFRNDLWSLPLSSPSAWQQLAPTGPAPLARRHYSAYVDPVRHELVITGGAAYDPAPVVRDLKDTWRLSLTGPLAWTPVATATQLLERSGHRAVYDATSDRAFVFGGYHNAYLQDTWILDFTASLPTWTELPLPPPPPTVTFPSRRRDHVAFHDPVRDRLVVFGGWDGAYKNDVWTYDLTAETWSLMTVAGTPPAGRFAHAGAYDPLRDRLIVFGGYGGTFRNDVWQLSLSGVPTWTQIHPAGPAPVGRNAMSASYDPVRDQFVVFGGYSGTAFLNDLWGLQLSGSPEWVELDQNREPDPRRHYASIYDPERDMLLVHGGFDGTYLDDAWGFDFDAERWRRPLGGGRVGPSGRFGHKAALDESRRQMIVFGGYGITDGPQGEPIPVYLGDVWQLSLDPPRRWGMVHTTGAPPARRLLHSATYDPVRNRVLVFGGASQGDRIEDTLYNDLWALEFLDEAPAPENARSEPESSSKPVGLDLALRGATPNPSRGAFDIAFTLPSSGNGALEVYSVTGARAARRDLTGFAPGSHTVRLKEALRPGIYWIRLTHDHRSVSARVAVVP